MPLSRNNVDVILDTIAVAETLTPTSLTLSSPHRLISGITSDSSICTPRCLNGDNVTLSADTRPKPYPRAPPTHVSHNLTEGFSVVHDTEMTRRFNRYIECPDETSDFLVNYFHTNIKDPSGASVMRHFGTEALRVLKNINAGGNSIVSEALSADLFAKMYKARNVRTEMEIEYIWHNWKICDMTMRFPTSDKVVSRVEEIPFVGNRGKEVRIKHVNVGISVTRAMMYPNPDEFTLADAVVLLDKKLNGLVSARSGVCDCDAFYKSILHIWCQTPRIAELLREAYTGLPKITRDNVLIICTVAENQPFIFFNRYQRVLTTTQDAILTGSDLRD